MALISCSSSVNANAANQAHPRSAERPPTRIPNKNRCARHPGGPIALSADFGKQNVELVRASCCVRGVKFDLDLFVRRALPAWRWSDRFAVSPPDQISEAQRDSVRYIPASERFALLAFIFCDAARFLENPSVDLPAWLERICVMLPCAMMAVTRGGPRPFHESS